MLQILKHNRNGNRNELKILQIRAVKHNYINVKLILKKEYDILND